MKTNVKVKVPAPRTHEGAIASRIDAEAQLRRSVMACMLWEDSFYEQGVDIAQRIEGSVKLLPFEKVADIAVEARTKMKLRHAPLLLTIALIKSKNTGRKVGDLIYNVVQRPDELGELVAMYWKDQKDAPFTKQMKVGLARAIKKFDEYQLAKWNKDGAVKLRDVLFLTHARPVKAGEKFEPFTKAERRLLAEKGIGPKRPPTELENIFHRIAIDQLTVPDTWEVKLSAGEDKKATFERLMAEKKLGALAFLRNLRGMLEAGVDEALMRKHLETLNVERVLPFRFITAARYAPRLEDALEAAMMRGMAGVEKLPGRTAIVVDNSGSMVGSVVSARSELTRQDAASALAILVREICEEAVVIGFGTDAAVIPARRGFALAQAIRKGPGGGTDTGKALKLAKSMKYDRVIIITDEQSHTSIDGPGEGKKGYVVNVASYQNGIGYGKWVHIDGWSEHVLDYIRAYEEQ